MNSSLRRRSLLLQGIYRCHKFPRTGLLRVPKHILQPIFYPSGFVLLFWGNIYGLGDVPGRGIAPELSLATDNLQECSAQLQALVLRIFELHSGSKFDFRESRSSGFPTKNHSMERGILKLQPIPAAFKPHFPAFSLDGKSTKEIHLEWVNGERNSP